jgi:hypothetical protein
MRNLTEAEDREARAGKWAEVPYKEELHNRGYLLADDMATHCLRGGHKCQTTSTLYVLSLTRGLA